MEEWLSAIGLAERIEAFRAQRIAFDDLPHLTDADLRELGLTIGERKRFRRAVARLATPGSPRDMPPQRAHPVATATTAERRPLTMMFVDLVDSSALAEQLEVEDLLEVIRAYREHCGAAVMRYGGHIARFVGDGILAYFCYPVSNENDPERAIRAALGIVRGIGRLATPNGIALSVRIGIATGRVIVSDLFAGGGTDKQSIIGSTPNLAARLQGLAAANGIVVAEETHARTAGLFDFEDLGPRAFKGFGSTHHAWAALRERTQQERLAVAAPRLTRIHDRRKELALLRRLWTQARSGNGCATLIVGEAGIGKSRLLEAFLSDQSGTIPETIRLAASALDIDSPFYPVLAQLQTGSGILATEDDSARMVRLGSLLGPDDDPSVLLPALAGLFGIEATSNPQRSATPEQVREQLLSFLLRQLLAPSQRAACCLVVEDLHWLDPSSLELLGRLIRAIDQRPMLVLLTARAPFDPAILGTTLHTQIQVKRLPQTDAAAMVRDMLHTRAVSDSVVAQIAQRTDGVPLFVEQYARTLLQSDESQEMEGDQLVVPASIDELLFSRLDRTGPAKQIAQIAAVVGRTVSRPVLQAVAEVTTDQLDSDLDTLIQAGVLFFAEPAAGHERFAFSHALLRDAAYDSLLRDRRRALHFRVARALRDLEPDQIGRQPEVLALHLTEAGAAEEAADLWMEAARRSLDRSALTEATRMLRRGLAALASAEPSARIVSLRIRLGGLLGPALIALKGPGAEETRNFYSDAVALCRGAPEDSSHFPIYWGWWRVAADCHAWVHRAVFLREKAEVRRDPEFLLQAHHCNWASHYHVGEFRRSCEHIAAGLAIYRDGDYRHHARLFGNHDPKVCGHGEMALIHWMQGRPVAALREEEMSMGWAEGLDHLGSRVHAMDIALTHRMMRGDHREVFRRSAAFIDFAAEHGLKDHRAKGLIFRGWTVAMQEDTHAGLNALQEGFAMQQDIGTIEDFPIYVCMLADALMATGNPERAIEELVAARRKFEEFGLSVWLPEILRITAEAMAAAEGRTTDTALALLDEASRVAAAQEARMLGLRIAASRGRMTTRTGDRVDVRAALAMALAAIEEPAGSRDVLVASSLLDEMEEPPGGAGRA